MVVWWKASQCREMFCIDPEVMGSNVAWVELCIVLLGLHSPFVDTFNPTGLEPQPLDHVGVYGRMNTGNWNLD